MIPIKRSIKYSVISGKYFFAKEALFAFEFILCSLPKTCEEWKRS
jgi:hypothetical protein